MVKAWWELPGEDLRARGFFPAVARCFPSATTLFVEGCAIDSEVLSRYNTHREPGRYLPGRDTVFPRSTTRRCRFEESLVNQIEQLAASHGVPALFDHVTVYSGADPLIYWHDAFKDVLRINGNVEVYPPAARLAGMAGNVVVEIVIDETGTPLEPKILGAEWEPAFAYAAMEAVREWKFSPAHSEGRAIPILFNLRINFTLGSSQVQ